MYADGIITCGKSRQQVEANLERWRYGLERRGIKVSRSQTEYMRVKGKGGSGTVQSQGAEVVKVDEFKYLGLAVQSNEDRKSECRKRVQTRWSGWRNVTGVICDRRGYPWK